MWRRWSWAGLSTGRESAQTETQEIPSKTEQITFKKTHTQKASEGGRTLDQGAREVVKCPAVRMGDSSGSDPA